MSIPPEEREPPPPSSAEEALRRLEQRLDRATEAAERLMAEAAIEAAARAGDPTAAAGDPTAAAGSPTAAAGSPAAAAGNPARGADDPGRPAAGNGGEPRKPPPAGWQIPEDARAAIPDIDPFISLVQAVRELIPPELQRRLVAAVRELLLALRALIDWYLERLERKREQSVEVEDIPIL